MVPSASSDSTIAANNVGLRISVAIATYNGDQFLKDQLESIAQQTLPPFEVVVTDDGSTDRTLEIVREFANSVNFRVRAFSNPTRLGYADNFLHAASLCDGDLIAFCDQDDVWVKEKLEVCAAAFEDETVLLCVHNGYVWNGQEVSGLFPDWGATKINEPLTLDPRKFVPGFAMVFRANLCRLLSYQERFQNTYTLEPAGHDQWVWFLAVVSGRVAQTERPLVYYRQHLSNTCGAPEPTTWKERLLLVLMDPPYEVLAVAEAKCAEFAQTLSTKELPEDFRNNAKISARKLSARAQLHLLRGEAYSPKSGFLKRLKNLLMILRLGGYSNGSEGYSFGQKALCKDLALELTRIRLLLKFILN